MKVLRWKEFVESPNQLIIADFLIFCSETEAA